MRYVVSINYYNFVFTNLSSACSFATMAKENANVDVNVVMEFLNEKENNNED